MKAEDRERLQDYLDDRMSDAERSAFEARLAGDAELASRVEWHRSVAGHLRESEELSPGFYTRARARFEESSRGAKGPRLPWLRWEVAGLAGAALLAAAIFLPGILREKPALQPGAADQVEAPAVDRRVREEAATPPLAEPVKSGLADAPGRLEPESGILESGEGTEEAEAPAEPSDEDDAFRQTGAKQASAKETEEGQSAAAAAGAVGEVKGTAEVERNDEPDAETPPPVRKSVVAQTEPVPIPVREEAGLRENDVKGPAPPPAARYKKQAQDREEARGTDLQKLSAAANFSYTRSAAVAALAVELPAGLLETNEKRVIDDAAGWNDLVRGRLASSADAIGEFRDDLRLVLIGADASGTSCADLRVQDLTGGNSVWLLVPRGGDSAGCAVRLPDDGREIQVVWLDE